ncbi:MAG TPA: penicillin acylase family protein, partial [Chroococcales cyanobacterium]
WQYEVEESWRLDDLRQRILDRIGEKGASKFFNQSLKQDIVSQAAEEGAGQNRYAARQLTAECAGLLDRARNFQPSSLTGSNAWVVSGQLSDSKGALLACDKHSPLTLPDRFYLCSINTPKLHLAGATIPGVPGIMLGRNEEIGWGSAALRADTQDLFLEQFSPQFPSQYKTASGWQNAVEVSEDINVRFGNPVVQKVLITRHGPILLKKDNNGVALCWTALRTAGQSPLDTLQKLSTAGNWQDFSKALAAYTGPAETFVYADRHGNVGYHAAGEVPVRRADQGNIIEPGWTGTFDWQRNAAFTELPGEYNPPRGFALAGDPQIFTSYNFSNPYRADRILSLLQTYKKTAERAGLPDMAILQGDQFGHLSGIVKSELKEAANKVELIDRFQDQALKLLDRWDGVLKPDSSAAAVYESFLMTAARRIFEPKLGAALTTEFMQRWPRWSCIVEQVLTQKPKDWLPPEERTYETFLLTTFADSVTNIRKAVNSDDPNNWSWKNLHTATFHQTVFDESSALKPLFAFIFDKGPVGVGGDQDTVNSMNIQPTVDPLSYQCSVGPTVRLIMDMSDKDKFYETLTLGEDEHLLSPYRNDQLRPWLKFEPMAMAFSADQLDKHQHHKLVLSNE